MWGCPELSHGNYLYELNRVVRCGAIINLSHGSYLYELSRGCEMWGYHQLVSWQLLV